MRFISPSALLCALVMALLPWMEVRCEARGGPGGTMSITLYEQSGLQSTWGGRSAGSQLREAERDFKRAAKDQAEVKGLDGITPPTTSPAPLMIAYLLCLGIGALLGFAMPSGTGKALLLGGICVAASALMVTQIAVGFPFVKDFEQEEATRAADLKNRGETKLVLRYTPPFYLAVAAKFGSLVGVVLEAVNAPHRRRRRRRRHWDDDDDEGDYYDRRWG